MSEQDGLEWQAAGASKTAHIIDTNKTHPRRSGPRTLCGRYPQRNHAWWYALSVAELGLHTPALPYSLRRCEDCIDAHPEVGTR